MFRTGLIWFKPQPWWQADSAARTCSLLWNSRACTRCPNCPGCGHQLLSLLEDPSPRHSNPSPPAAPPSPRHSPYLPPSQTHPPTSPIPPRRPTHLLLLMDHIVDEEDAVLSPIVARELLQGYVDVHPLVGFPVTPPLQGPSLHPHRLEQSREHSGTESQAGPRGPHTPAPHLAPEGHPAPFAASGALPPPTSS